MVKYTCYRVYSVSYYITKMPRRLFNRFLNDFKSDLLFKNSIYLMASTAVMSGLGFFFWLIAANLYSSSEIGISTTIISVTSLITGISLLGLGSGVIKYFARSDSKSEMVNSALWLTFLFSLVCSTIFLISIPVFVPQLSILISNPIMAVLFALFTSFYTLNILFDDIFVAHRRADFIFIKNSIFSFSKILLLYPLILYGSIGIFSAFGIGSSLATIFSILILVVFLKHELIFSIDLSIVKKIIKFSLANYLAFFIYGLPSKIIPLMITGILGADRSAYFYIALMITNLLYVIPISVSQSLFVEGTHQELHKILPKSLKIIAVILIPCVLIIIFAGSYLLRFFGDDYAISGSTLLQLLAISSLFIAVNSIGESLLKLHHRVGRLIWINIVYASLIIGLTVLLADLGLTGVGIAFVIGSAVATILHIFSSREYLLTVFGGRKLDHFSE